MFSVSLITADSYQSPPLPDLDPTFSDFRGKEIKHVPVIRIFGSTSTGNKTCLHIHGVFPYIYIPCTVTENSDIFAYKLASSIDAAINVSLGCANSKNQHVYRIQQVSGVPYYGYHENEHLFYKVYFYNPALTKRIADLLQNGAVLNQSFQPFEAHIPFVLQFMIDYNLYGMSYINLKNVKYRQSEVLPGVCSDNKKIFQSPDLQEYLPTTVIRQSMCELEVDAVSLDILNKDAIKDLELNPGLAAIWEDEKLRRAQMDLPEVQSQLLYTQTSKRQSFTPTINDIYQEERLMQRLQIISQTDDSVLSTTTTSTYPIEVKGKNDEAEDENTTQFCVSNLEFTAFDASKQREETQQTPVELSNSILDANDVDLVNILNKLAEENSSPEIVDNDSVLGSQGSVLIELAKDNNEEEDVEDLNMTCFELDTLSSWSSACNSQKSGLEKNDEKLVTLSKANSLDEPNLCNNEDLKLPQYDGGDDILLNNLRFNRTSSSCLQLTPTEQNCSQNKHDCDTSINFAKTVDNKELHYLNLDVYDTDEILSKGIKDASHEQKMEINKTRCSKNSHKENFKCRSFKIPSIDGNTVVSSSDSEPEPEPDITITREEAQVCIYNSCRKKNTQKIVKTTPTKRKRNDEDPDFCTPKKARNIDSAAKSSYNSPSRRASTQSPQTSRSYTPLNITISSPKTSKVNPSAEDPLDTILTRPCTTPRRKIDQIRENLLREESTKTSPRRRKLKDTLKELQPITESNELQENEVELSSEKSSMVITKTHSDTTLATSSTATECNKDARKRLSFCSNDTNSSNHSNVTRRKSNSQQGVEVDLVHSENVANEEGININQLQKVSRLENTLDEKNSVGQFEDDSDNVNEILSDEETSCNMTFTQCIDTKLRDSNQSFSLNEIIDHELTERVVVIKSRFCPPNRNHITKSMKTYDIMKDSREELFGKCKNKVSYKISNCSDIVPFKSSLDNITGLKRWRRMKVNEFHPSGAALKTNGMKQALAGYNLYTIKPLFVPPTPKNVQKWLRAKEYLVAMNKKSNSEKDVDLTPKSAHEENVDSVTENETSNQTLLGVNTSKGHVSCLQNSHNNQTLNSTGSNNSCEKSADFSLQKMLTNSSLFKDTQTSKHLGISYGQIECLSKDSTNNLTDENFQNARTLTMYRYLTVLSLELHVVTRGDLLPDPLQDPIEAIFYAVQNDVPPTSEKKQLEHGAIILRTSTESKFNNIHSTNTSCPVIYVQSEKDLLDNLIILIRKWDPDILVGWELETLSWGYIFQRSSHINVQHFLLQISRIPDTTTTHNAQEQDVIYFSDVKVPGRIILDVWRIMRHEIALLNYTFENIMYHVMHERHSCPSFKTLTNWWTHLNMLMHYKVINHYLVRVLGTLRILSQLDVIGRTSEHARLFGIQFYEVFSRGSQFRVESIMLRLAKPLNFIAISPSVQQRAKMRAPESLPLIMEPKSTFYTDPLIVLDFQSLYPSIIIAYNYCFSTCLGRIEHIGQYDPFEFGAATLRVTKRRILKLKDKLNFAPCGVAYVKREVRQGVLPRMLTEILNTRLMVKQSMKVHSGKSRLLQRVLDSQQLGLKLIANVTYGYTAANFSGRMPCIEVGDSVVSKGRETLERAIQIVESTSKWGAQVVYGDTDSIFVLVRGKSRKEAFEIGAEIADVVTAANPAPVKLKFEKVLHPSILQTKKRYCGYMYEDLKQEKPEYLAKGIETVRRDGCPAVAKILEKSLRILFETGDISLIKKYVTRQFDKILCKRVSIQDLTFAKEFRGLNGYKSSACVPALELTRRLMKKDPRAIPRTSERVRYVIVAGAPNQPLIQCVRTPSEVIDDSGLTPNALYYITKGIIPPLNRCLNLINVDVNVWYREMSHRLTLDKAPTLLLNNQKSTICHFFNSIVCATCGEQSYQEICSNCMKQPYQTIVILNEKLRWLERTYYQINTICQSCTGDSGTPDCKSLDCPVFYRITTARKDLHQVSYLRNIIHDNE